MYILDGALARFGNAWVELFRNIPLLVQIFVWYHVIPALFLPMRQLPDFILVVFLFVYAAAATHVPPPPVSGGCAPSTD